MRPKGKLFALLVIFVAIGLVTATGAFSTVSATRTAEVNVAGDAAALLQLEPYAGPNGYNPDGGGTASASEGYAQLTGGQLEISINGDFNSSLGSGVNINATTDIQNVFNVTNQGTQTVNLNITDTGSDDTAVVFYSADGGNAKTLGGLEEDESGASASLTPGQTLTVSIYIDADGTPTSGDLVTDITITATTP